MENKRWRPGGSPGGTDLGVAFVGVGLREDGGQGRVGAHLQLLHTALLLQQVGQVEGWGGGKHRTERGSDKELESAECVGM